jgi:mono/diheme cytochrome c family protein
VEWPLLFLCVFSIFALNPNTARAQKKHEPPIAEFMTRLGGKVPFPPEKIIDILQAQGIEMTGSAVVPHGRSLERHSTSYKRPRSMMSFYFGKKDEYGRLLDPDRFVFVAYTPAKNQLEIIGSSKNIPQDFLLVSNYTRHNHNAKPHAPKQGVGLCLSCHQNGGAIFSIPGWNETNQNDSVADLLKKRNTDPLAKRLLEIADKSGKTSETKLFHTITGFNQAVRVSSYGSAQTPDIPPDFLRPSSELSDRDPVGHEMDIFSGASHDPLVTPYFRTGGMERYENKSSAWKIPLSRDGVKSYPRTSVRKLFKFYCSSCHQGTNAVAGTLNFNDLKSLRDFRGAANRTVVGLLLDKTMPPIPGPLPSSEDRQRMIQALTGVDEVKTNSKRQLGKEFCLECDSKTTKKKDALYELRRIQQTLVFKSCMDCHNGNGDWPPHISFGDPDLLEIELKKKALYTEGTVYDAIVHRIRSDGPDRMPIQSEFSPDDRKAIIDYLDSMKADSD